MDREKFTLLVNQLELQAKQYPSRYQRKVVLLALLGNAYIALMLVLITLLLLGLVVSIVILKALAIKLIIIVGAFLFLLIKAIWVKVEPPTGTEVSSQDAPELFAMIEEIRQRLNSPRFHHVLITDDFNAAVVQAPRLGVFGWDRNYLLIGLPLMKLLNVEQFKAVLAHEFGHLAKGHGRLSHWIYRQRIRWMQILQVLEQTDSNASFMFKPFLKWFAPYFNAYSFPMARADEYEADRIAAELTSPQAAAQALTSVNVAGNYLHEHFWPSIHKQADCQPQPTGFVPFCNMGQEIHQALNDSDTQKWLEQALKRTTDVADTHPSLSDRLHALNTEPCFLPPLPEQAADFLLGQARAQITQSFDSSWQNNISDAWQKRYQEVQQGRRNLVEIELRLERGEILSVDEALQRAKLTEAIAHEPEKALQQFQDLYQHHPDHALVCYALGSRLLSCDDESGIRLLEKAMSLNESAAISACELIRDYYWRNEQTELAHSWHDKYLAHAQTQYAATLERQQIYPNDIFLPHDLDEATLDKICVQLHEIPHLREVYLAKKQLKHFPDLT